MKNIKHKIWGVTILLCSVVSAVLLISPVFATIAQPDSAPTVSFTHINRNVLTPGDVVITGEYNIPYATLPTINADQTFYIRIMNGVTEIGSITPFVYFNNGYSHGAFMLYFASGYTWDSLYTIRISENPSQFSAPINFDYVINIADYFESSTTQLDNQADLASNVLKIANDIQTHYTTYTFTQSAPGRTVLAAPTGETYFSNAMPGL